MMTGKHSLVVNSPSDSDNQEQYRTMEENLKVYATEIDNLKKKMEDGMISLKQESKMIKMIQNMTQLEPCLKITQERSRTLGRCFASSGNRVGLEGYSLDWALIEVIVPCVFDNKVSFASLFQRQFTKGLTDIHSFQTSMFQSRFCHQRPRRQN